MLRPLVLKVGGELVETPAQRAALAAFCAGVRKSGPLVVIHGGGRAVDAELQRRGIAPKKVEGLRVTDRETLDVVVAVLAGSSNTELVAAFVAAHVPAVGLTGVDAGFGRALRVSEHQTTSGAVVDLGFVGDPTSADPGLIRTLLVQGYVPVVASVGIEEVTDAGEPVILNVNADVMACRIAASLGQCDLVIAGGTAGVLDAAGAAVPLMDLEAIDRAVESGMATAGMVAKLMACRTALVEGVASVRIIDGRGLGTRYDIDTAPGTLLVAAAGATTQH